MTINYYDFPEPVAQALQALSDHYEYDAANNQGANGYVIFGRNKVSSADIAIKFYFGAQGEAQHDEPRLLASVRSPHVLEIFDARLATAGWAYFITPRCFDGDVDAFLIARPSVHSAIDVAIGICSGASALHAMRMVHRDLKPANIVLADGAPRIADFGSVRMLEKESNDVLASSHSVLYRPPESFVTGRYTIKGDVYQIGLVAYQLLGGHLPYEYDDYFNEQDRRNYAKLSGDFERSAYVDQVIQRRAESGTLVDSRSLPVWIDPAAKRSIRKMVDPDPKQRYATTADVAADLTAIRARIRDWRWNGNTATFWRDEVCFELRPLADGRYEAFRDNGAGFRRVPKVDPGSLSYMVGKLA